MRSITKTLHVLLGIFLVILGIAGLILPILNGTIFLLLGLIILSFQYERIEYHINRFVYRNETIGKLYDKLRSWLEKFFRD